MRPDAARFLRPDAGKFLKPGSDPVIFYPAFARQRDAARRADDRKFDATIAHERATLDSLRRDLASIKSALRRHRLAHDENKYSPNQPRVPAGSGRESGQWTSGGGGSGSPLESFAQDTGADIMLDEIVVDGSDSNPGFDGPAGDGETSRSNNDFVSSDSTSDSDQSTGISDRRVVSDADPEDVRPGAVYAANGHHIMPQAIFRKWDLLPETRRVFNSDTTGQLPGGTTVRTSPDGVPLSHGWNIAHREYNEAVRELSTSFMKRNDVDPRNMTPSQARQLLGEVRDSQDPRIRDFNRAMQMLRRVFRFRFGRSE